VKTTLASIGVALTSTLTTLAALPYTLGDAATIIPAEWKLRVVIIGLISTAILKVIQGVVSADAKPVAPAPLPPFVSRP